ncbi:MAG: MFS transporter [Candidatus Tectomicrobia bacterium]|nr:MFS transporter [Candidatus Tectomicrobia bacterium]
MDRWRSFAYIMLADFIVRAAYQMGKTPLLPIFARALGATDAFLGFIVSVSTLTGIVLKPFIGIFSDRWGRRRWLLGGTTFFTAMPFVYRFVHTPDQLFVVRIIHGLATAIYGPVTLAYVAEQSQGHIAERLGWFSIARNAGYIVGPAVAGWMMLTMDPISVFTAIGLLSSLAFLPILLLPESALPDRRRRSPLVKQALHALISGSKTPSVWLAGGLDATMYTALYAVKAFLPIYALSIGVNIAVIGSFFAVQEAVHILLNPWGGRLGDRFGYLLTVSLGMALVGAALPLLTFTYNSFVLMVPSLLMGVAQAVVLPSTVALVSQKVDQNNIGAGMGLVGTLENVGKVAGPTLAGVLIQSLGFTPTFRLIGVALLLSAMMVWYRAHLSHKTSQKETPVSL